MYIICKVTSLKKLNDVFKTDKSNLKYKLLCYGLLWPVCFNIVFSQYLTEKCTIDLPNPMPGGLRSVAFKIFGSMGGQHPYHPNI